MSFKSLRGPLPRAGGPQSKAFYQCKICDKNIRRDKLKEHYGTYVDMIALNNTGQVRSFALSKLASEKRKHTEQVKEFFACGL